MRFRHAVVLFLFSLVLASAQEITQAPRESVNVPGAGVPRLVKFSASAPDAATSKAQREEVGGSVRSLTFALFAEQTGGSPLWTESQNVQVASDGRYTVMLGAATKGGVPAEMFANGEARWLEVSANGAAAQRYLLVSVPYALKAEDAEKLGGRSLGDFVLSSELTQRVRETLQAVASEGGMQALREPILSTTTQGVDGNGSITFTDNSAFSAVIVTQNGTGSGLEATAVGLNGIGLIGRATSTTGLNAGVKGESASTNGRGVLGTATASSGSPIGVEGTTLSPSGTGVQGSANSTTGGAGVRGIVPSGTGIGVQGDVFSASAIAGKFTTTNAAGLALYAGGPGGNFTVSGSGDITANSLFLSSGVLSLPGGTVSADTGVFSSTSFSSAITALNSAGGEAIHAVNAGPSGSAIIAQNTDFSNTDPTLNVQVANSNAIAAYFENSSGGQIISATDGGLEMFGVNSSSSGLNAAVVNAYQDGSTATNPDPFNLPPTAVRGEATATSDFAFGVLGVANSPDSTGVVGINRSTGGGAGVLGVTMSENGDAAVSAESFGTIGNAKAFKGRVNSASGTALQVEGVSGSILISGQIGPDGSETEVFRVDDAGVVTATAFVGDGSGLTGITASGGTSANTANTLVQRDANGDFSAGSINAAGTISASNFSGAGTGLSGIPNAATTATSANLGNTIVSRDVNGDFSVGSVNAAGTVTASNFSGPASGLSGIPNSATSATSANSGNTIVLRDVNGDFSAGSITAAANVTANSFTGAGSGLSGIPNSATSATSANSSNTIVARNASGDFSAGTISATAVSAGTFSGSGSGLTSIPNSATSATSANSSNTIVARNVSGDFSAGTITATAFSGDGSSLTNITASNTANLGGVAAANYARRDVGNSFTSSQSIAGDLTLTGTATVTALGGVFDGLGGGILGRDTSTGGATAGVQGIVASNSGNGVSGRATSPTGTTTGVFGRSDGDNGAGVLGTANSTTGITAGIRGWAVSPNGKGAEGDSFPTSSNAVQTSGTGVYGTYGYNSNFTINNNASHGTAIYGENIAPGGFPVAVRGHASNTSGTTSFGVSGQSQGSSGVGTEGLASHATGTTIGVSGQVVSPNGVAGKFNNTAGGNILEGWNNNVQKFRFNGNGDLLILGDLTANSISGTFSGTASNSYHLGGVAAANYARLDIGNTFSDAQAMFMSVAGPGLAVQQTGSGLGMDVQANTANAIQGTTGGAGSAGVVGASSGAGGMGLFGIAANATATALRLQTFPSGTLISGYNGSDVFVVDGNGNVTATSFTGDGGGLANVVATSATNAAQLGGIAAANYALLGAASQTWSGAQTFNVNNAGYAMQLSQSGTGNGIAVNTNANGAQSISATTSGTSAVAVAGSSNSGVAFAGSVISGTAASLTVSGGGNLIVGNDGSTDTFQLTREGKVTIYGGENTSGNGVTSIVASSSLLLQPGQPSATLFVPATGGLFRFVYVVVVRNTGAPGTMNVAINFQDEQGSAGYNQSFSNAAGTRFTDSQAFRAVAGLPITFNVTNAGGSTFDFYITLERLQ